MRRLARNKAPVLRGEWIRAETPWALLLAFISFTWRDHAATVPEAGRVLHQANLSFASISGKRQHLKRQSE